jgi:hypothetical protein
MKKISKLAAELQIKPSRLRSWHRLGLCIATQTETGRLVYTPEQEKLAEELSKLTPTEIAELGRTVSEKPLSWYLERGHARRLSETAIKELILLTPNCKTTDNTERFYWVRAGLTEYPTCKECQQPLSSKHWGKYSAESDLGSLRYRDFCSVSCASKNEVTLMAKAETSLKNYGVEVPMRSPLVLAKIKTSNLQKHGLEYPHKFGSDLFQARLLEKFGVSTVRAIPGVSEKIAQTKLEETLKKVEPTIAAIEQQFDVVCLSEPSLHGQTKLSAVSYTWRHSCGHEYSSRIVKDKFGNDKISLCDDCFITRSHGEQQLGDFIEELGVELVRNDRSVISPKELDIWIPSKKIAVEFDGTYWHSAKFVDAEKAIEKLKQCEQLGIHLITVQENIWHSKPDIVKNRLRSVLGLDSRRYARSCSVSEISSKEASKFLNAWHLQGSAAATVQLGLRFKDDLVAVMTFGRPRWSKMADWELIRFASAGTIVGGASKLLAAFRRTHHGSIISYADSCWSSGNLYKALNFSFSHYSKPSYWWVSEKDGIFSRYQTQKKKLPNLFQQLNKPFIKELSESSNMELAGFLKVFDRGNTVWLLS